MISRSKRVVIILLVLAALLAIVQSLRFFQSQIQYAYEFMPVDMLYFAHAGEDFWKTGQLYQRSGDYAWTYAPGAPVFKFPPPFQFAIAPWFIDGKPPAFFMMARHVEIALYLLSIVVLVGLGLRSYPGQGTAQQAIFAFVMILVTLWCYPFFVVLQYIQAELAILFLLVMVFALYRRLPVLAGLLLAYAFAIKIYPAFILLFFVYQRSWRVIAGFGAGSVVMAALSVAMFGWSENLFYLQNILPVLLGEYITYELKNMNIEVMLAAHGLIDGVSGVIFNASRLFFLGVTAVVLWRQRHFAQQDHFVVYAVFVTMLLLLLPNYWVHYFVLMLLPLACLLALSLQGRCWLGLMVCLLAAVILVASPDWHTYIVENYTSVASMDENSRKALYLEALAQGPGTLLWRYTKAGWLLYWIDQCKPLLPLLLWIMLLLNLEKHHDRPIQ